MSYQLSIQQKPNYLHATVTGPNTRENVEGYLQELKEECLARNCFRVLIEKQLHGPLLGTLDIFEIISEESRKIPAALEAVAYVDAGADPELIRFAETVAVNRSIPAKVFASVDEAEKWLNEKPN